MAMKLFAISLFAVAVQGFKPLVQRTFASAVSSLSAASFYEIVEKDATGKDVSFEKFKGMSAH